MSRSEVAPGLYVGSKPLHGRHDVDVIVLAAEEYQPHATRFPDVEVIHVPLDDAPTRPMREGEIKDALRAADRVAQHLRAGRRVLVSCALGLNRSALIAAIAMHDVYGMAPDEIIRRLRQARGPWALSNCRTQTSRSSYASWPRDVKRTERSRAFQWPWQKPSQRSQ